VHLPHHVLELFHVKHLLKGTCMDILNCGRFAAIEPINKGWSGDKKYCATEKDGTKRLLRIAPASRYEAQKLTFGMMEKVAALGVPMCLPLEFGACENGAYSIQSWIDGENLEQVLPKLPEPEQYALGLKSGEIAIYWEIAGNASSTAIIMWET